MSGFCCKPFERAVKSQSVEWHNWWHVCQPNAGSYVLTLIRFCPFCGKELSFPKEPERAA